MKSTKLFKLAALVLALVFCFGIFAACANNNANTNSGSNSGNKNPSGSKGNGGTDTSAIVGNPDNVRDESEIPTFERKNRPGGDKEPTGTLQVGYGDFSQKFSPFYAETAYDQDAVGLTQLGMMTTDRNGDIIWNAIEGETTEYEGKEYFYQGPCDLVMERINEGESDEMTVYTITLAKGIYFSDGVEVTADDIIFSMYVILDPYYTGANTLNSVGVRGYEAYRYNSDAIDQIRDKVDDYIYNLDAHKNMQEWVIENVITRILAEELEWVKSFYEDPEHAPYPYGDPESEYYIENPLDVFVMFYGREQEIDTSKSEEEVLQAVVDLYGYDHEALAIEYGYGVLDAPNAFIDQAFEDAAYECALADYEAEGGTSNPVPNVAGIKKLNNYVVQVTCEGFMANAVYQVCAGTIAPMHYYGDESLFDYENDMFGFEARTPNGLDIVSDSAKTTNPMGAGAYKFIEYNNRTVRYEANETYFLGCPRIQYLNLKETNNAEMITGVATGTIDIGDPSASKKALEEICQYNTDTNEISGSVIESVLVWNLGYGYVGINAEKVNVGGKAGSDESKALRKALATVLAVYREVAYDSYYGDSAEVIEYPISTTSWAAPKPADPGYKIAFSEDADGNEIYTDGMSQDEKFDAALDAAITWLKEAGYEWDESEGKFVSAPDGAKMEYEILVPGNGKEDHPNYLMCIDAKNALAKIGIKLEVNDCVQNTLWQKLDGGDQELWSAAWGSTIDPDMYQVYHSTNRLAMYGGSSNTTNSNKYALADDELDELIMAARASDQRTYRKTAYKTCLDIILDWAVEVPCYQRKNMTIFSAERINLDTITPDITTYWSWMGGLEDMELN